VPSGGGAVPSHGTNDRVSATTAADVAGLVLAAGRGRRFGGPKLAALLEGRPLLAHVLAAAADARTEGLLAELVVVIPAGEAAPPEAALLRSLAEEAGAAVVANDRPEAGLARSVRLGLAALAGSGDRGIAAVLVLLGDQPRVPPDAIRALVTTWRRTRAALLVPRYRGVPGNPVVAGREAWAHARRLRGDAGLRAVAARHPELVSYLNLGGDNPDVDRPADLLALRLGHPARATLR
jgi:molybdenum cofactor cytidylyltransferase